MQPLPPVIRVSEAIVHVDVPLVELKLQIFVHLGGLGGIPAVAGKTMAVENRET